LSKVKNSFDLWFYGREFLASSLFHEIGHHYYLTVLQKSRDSQQADEHDAMAYQDEYLNRAFSRRLNRASIHKDYQTLFGVRVGRALSEKSKRKEQVDTSIKRAETCRQSGQYEEAVEELTAAMELEPCNDQLYFYRGTAYGLANDFDRAVQDLIRAVRLNPGCTGAFYNIAWTYGKMGKHEEAITYLNRYIAINTEDWEAYLFRGYRYLEMQMNRQAGEDFEVVCSIKPDEYKPYYAKACLAAVENNAEEACKWLQEAVAKGLSDPEARKSDSYLDNIRLMPAYQAILSRLEDQRSAVT
jgi:tetratricopeptide (TPR) repeat protein